MNSEVRGYFCGLPRQTLESPPLTHWSKSSESVPGTVLSSGKAAVTKIDIISCSNEAYILAQETDDEQINKKIQQIEVSTLEKEKAGMMGPGDMLDWGSREMSQRRGLLIMKTSWGGALWLWKSPVPRS